MRLIKRILTQADILVDFLRLTPSQLLTFIQSDGLLNFKSKLDLCKTINELLMVAEKDKGLLKKALKKSKNHPKIIH